MHVISTTDSYKPEEHKHKNFPHAFVAVGQWAAGIQNRSGNRRDANCDDRPAATRSKIKSGDKRKAKHDPHAAQYLRRREQAGLRDAQRPNSIWCVGTALKIKHVVGKVGADLKQQRTEQRRKRWQ